MRVDHVKSLGNGHSIELGGATWDATVTAVRNRYARADGGFNASASGQVAIYDLVPMVEFVAQHDAMSPAECARLIEALASSIRRKTGKPEQAEQERTWSEELRVRTAEVLRDVDYDALGPDLNLHFKHIARRFSQMSVDDLRNGELRLVDKQTGDEVAYATVEELINAGWALD